MQERGILAAGVKIVEFDWEKNLGTADRVIRVLVGVALLALVLTKNIVGWWATGAIILAIFQFIEAFFAY